MAVNVTRDMVNQYKTSVTSGTTPVNLHIRDIDDFIPIIGREDEPMLGLIKGRGTHNKEEYEYGQGDLAPSKDVMPGSALIGDTTITVTNGTYFQKWDMLRIADENLLVTGITGNALTVVRGWGSTSPAAIASAAEIIILGPSTPEGGISDESPIAQGETFINYSEITEYTFEMSHRGRVTPTYEFKQDDRFKAELKKKMIEARQDMGRKAIFGVKNLGDGVGGAAATNPSTTGGLLEFTTRTVVNFGGDPLTMNGMMDGLQTVYDLVGMEKMAKTAMGSMRNKRVWNSLFPEDLRRYSGKDEGAKITWEWLDTEFGRIRYVVNWNMRDSDGIVFWNPEDTKLSFYEGGNWSTGTYATQGWFDKGFLRCDFAFGWQGDDRRLRLTNLATPNTTNYPGLF
jgi:hypothetical protein